MFGEDRPRTLGLAAKGGRETLKLLRDRRSRAGAERIQSRLIEASRQLYGRLDTDEVLAATVEAVRSVLPASLVSIWLVNEDGLPTLSAWAGPGEEPAPPSPAILACATRARVIDNQASGTLCVPIVSGRSGVIGVIEVVGAGGSSAEAMMLESIGRVSGLGIDAASSHERALVESARATAILEHVADGIVVSDGDGVVHQLNPAAAALFPGAIAGSRCGRQIELHDADGPIDCAQGCALLERDADHGVEVACVRSDGARTPLLASVRAVRNARGAVSQVVHSFRDITKLKQADEAKTLFLATASHELRTPLTVILGFARTLLSSEATMRPDVRRHALEAIERRGSELSQIVERLLLTSRIEAGRVDINASPVDLRDLVAERVATLSLATGREISAAVPDRLPLVYADPVALATIMDHLIDNAVKYSDGAVRVFATTGAQTVELCVKDGGIGMDADEAAQCFERFWRSEPASGKTGGTGIGLYIVRSLARAMGGEVSVSSARGSGATFKVSLLIATEPVEAPTSGAQPGEPSIVREFMRQIGIQTRSAQ